MLSPGDVFALEAGKFFDLDDDPGLLIKGSQGLIYGWHVFTELAATGFIQVFDAATLGAVTLGSTVPKLAIAIPAVAGGAFSSIILPKPIVMANGIVVFSTTTPEGSTARVQSGHIFHA